MIGPADIDAAIARIAALVLKETLLLWKDSKTRWVILIPPLVQLLIFAFAASFEVRHAPLAIWDEDRTVAAGDLVRLFQGSTAFRLVGEVGSPGEARRLIDRQEATAILHIGQRFSAELATGHPATVQLIIDGRRSNAALILANYAETIVQDYDRRRLGLAGVLAARGPALEIRAWFNPNLDSQWFILPGLNALLVMVMTTLITALSVARERELGTFDQLLVTPLRPYEIMIGKVVPALAVGLFEGMLIWLVARYAFGVPFVGSSLLFGVAFLVFLLSAIGIGLAISTVSMTQQQAILGVFLFLSPAVILSGLATPIDNMPGWARAVSMVNPVRYMVELTRDLYLRNPPIEVVLGLLWPMAAIGCAALGCALPLFRKGLR